jgi:hypothetical protein
VIRESRSRVKRDAGRQCRQTPRGCWSRAAARRARCSGSARLAQRRGERRLLRRPRRAHARPDRDRDAALRVRVGVAASPRPALHARRRGRCSGGAARRLHVVLRSGAGRHLHARSRSLGDGAAAPAVEARLHVPTRQPVPRLLPDDGRRGRRHPRPMRSKPPRVPRTMRPGPNGREAGAVPTSIVRGHPTAHG